jgi:hypothetical protein
MRSRVAYGRIVLLGQPVEFVQLFGMTYADTTT